MVRKGHLQPLGPMPPKGRPVAAERSVSYRCREQEGTILTADVEYNVVGNSCAALCPAEDFLFEGRVLREDVERQRVVPGGA